MKTYQISDLGVFLYEQETQTKPHNSVGVEPPAATKGSVAIWETSKHPVVDQDFGEEETGKWVIKQDNRNDDLYHGKESYELGTDVNGQSYDGIGPIPEWLRTDPEPDTPEEIFERLSTQARATRDTKLTATNWLVERHREEQETGTTTLTAQQCAELLAYRQALRDVPQQAGFPESIQWPAIPEF